MSIILITGWYRWLTGTAKFDNRYKTIKVPGPPRYTEKTFSNNILRRHLAPGWSFAANSRITRKPTSPSGSVVSLLGKYSRWKLRQTYLWGYPATTAIARTRFSVRTADKNMDEIEDIGKKDRLNRLNRRLDFYRSGCTLLLFFQIFVTDIGFKFTIRYL